MIIQKLKKEDFDAWLDMGLTLWPDHSKAALKEEFEDIFKSEREETFLAKDDEDYIGFINVSLRYEFVQGAKSYPVGYIEGIFVKEPYRNKGIAKELVKAGEKWAKEKGCKEMASDAELDNKASQEFHKKLGFKQGDAIVHYIKRI